MVPVPYIFDNFLLAELNLNWFQVKNYKLRRCLQVNMRMEFKLFQME